MSGACECTWRLSPILSHAEEFILAESVRTVVPQNAVLSPFWAIYDSFKDSHAQRTGFELHRTAIAAMRS
jgi:hypothetical protein